MCYGAQNRGHVDIGAGCRGSLADVVRFCRGLIGIGSQLPAPTPTGPDHARSAAQPNSRASQWNCLGSP